MVGLASEIGTGLCGELSGLAQNSTKVSNKHFQPRHTNPLDLGGARYVFGKRGDILMAVARIEVLRHVLIGQVPE